MKTNSKRPFSVAATRVVACLCLLTGAWNLMRAAESSGPSPAGEIRGQVSNLATGAYLGSVSVKLRETGREYTTERDGSFAIGGLPPGRYSLDIEYPGLDRKTEAVQVSAGQVARVAVALSSEMYVLPQYVVAGQRECNAAAISEQRYAPNLANMITADAFGDITKANVGNLLRRIPDVTGITDDEIDTSVIKPLPDPIPLKIRLPISS